MLGCVFANRNTGGGRQVSVEGHVLNAIGRIVDAVPLSAESLSKILGGRAYTARPNPKGSFTVYSY